MTGSTHILGLSAFYHDSAACLVRDGAIVAAAQEERFTRRKHDAAFPRQAVDYVLREAGLRRSDLDIVAFYEKPFLKFDRILHSHLACAPRGLRTFLMAVPLWMRERIWMKDLIRRELPGFNGRMLFPSHHEAHAAAAFFPSPFPEAAFLTVDGVGEWTTTSYGTGTGGAVETLGELRFPHSLGLLYSAFTGFIGFKVNSGEYKLMGLAPYGEPRYADLIRRELVDLKEDGSFRLNLRYFNFAAGLTMTNRAFEKLFGRPPRRPESALTPSDLDLARSIQEVTEDIMLRLARHVRRATGRRNLCLAGGVALNCVANGRILREGLFERLWIQPAAGDAGGALGAALFAWHQVLGRPRAADGVHDRQHGSLLGPSFSRDEIRDCLVQTGLPFTEPDAGHLPAKVADLLAAGKVVGWFQGRMEFGPRALGARSILGDARVPDMQERMNRRIKFREGFRPFAPSVLREKAGAWFDLDVESPYMLLAAPVAAAQRRTPTPAEQARTGLDRRGVVRSAIPAVTHVDGSARVQTVDAATHPLFHRLLQTFDEKYGCPVLINTSFNVRGEPIVCTPDEACRCFMRTGMDALVLGPFLLEKPDVPDAAVPEPGGAGAFPPD